MRIAAIVIIVVSVALAGCGKSTPRPDAPTGTPEDKAAPAGDRERLQGVWGVEWMDSGNGATEAGVAKLASTDEEKADLVREIDRVRQGRFEFKGDKLSVALHGRRDEFTVALDETQTPKVMKLTSGLGSPMTPRPGTGRDTAPPQRETLEWIYKFEGDALVVAWTKGGKRPTAFKARRYQEPEPGKPGEPPIFVVTLKKTDVPPNPDPGPRRPTTTKK